MKICEFGITNPVVMHGILAMYRVVPLVRNGEVNADVARYFNR
jgi:hypothetical protein